MKRPLVLLSVLALLAGMGCEPAPAPQSPFARAEEAAWRAVNRSHTGADGIFVQAEWRTFGYEIASAYARAAADSLSQEQLEYRLKQLIHSYVDGSYPVADGTDINSLYYQYLVYVNPDFDPGNPLQRQLFATWRGRFVQRVIDTIYDPKRPVLRNRYDERWGLTLFSRLVFIVYLNGEEADGQPHIADIGASTVLVDDRGQRHRPSGLAGPYPYETDRPTQDVLTGEAVYRVFFPNRSAAAAQPLVTADSDHVELHIEGLGGVPVRRLRWELPLEYPELPQRRLPSEHGEDSGP